MTEWPTAAGSVDVAVTERTIKSHNGGEFVNAEAESMMQTEIADTDVDDEGTTIN